MNARRTTNCKCHMKSIVLVLFVLQLVGSTNGKLQWEVLGSVTNFGQTVILICLSDSCNSKTSCSLRTGWDAGRDNPNLRPRFLLVQNQTVPATNKYSGQYVENGFTLEVRNLSKDDIDILYECSVGPDKSDPKALRVKDAFTGSLNLEVKEKMTEFGQTLKLLCVTDSCRNKTCLWKSGWGRYIPSYETLLEDVRNLSSVTNDRYYGQIVENGFTLEIRNFSKKDLDYPYVCVIPFNSSNRVKLLEKDVLSGSSNGKGETGSSTGVIIVVALLTLIIVFAIVAIVCFKYKRTETSSQRGKTNTEKTSEELQETNTEKTSEELQDNHDTVNSRLLGKENSSLGDGTQSYNAHDTVDSPLLGKESSNPVDGTQSYGILSNKTISAIGDKLSWDDWWKLLYALGLDYRKIEQIQNDNPDNVCRQATVGLEEWREKGIQIHTEDQMVKDLREALNYIDRKDIIYDELSEDNHDTVHSRLLGKENSSLGDGTQSYSKLSNKTILAIGGKLSSDDFWKLLLQLGLDSREEENIKYNNPRDVCRQATVGLETWREKGIQIHTEEKMVKDLRTALNSIERRDISYDVLSEVDLPEIQD